jgi:hypothetical protein
MSENELKALLNVEEEFFDLDKEKKIAYMNLEFNTPKDIFDAPSLTKTPILNDDFMDWLQTAFAYAPKGYKIALDVAFDDLASYEEKDLERIFLLNMALEFKKTRNQSRRKNWIAYSLIGLGVLFFAAMMIMNHLWVDGGVPKEVIGYIADIATTVTFWEAMTILIVENAERRSYLANLARRFESIAFRKKSPKE